MKKRVHCSRRRCASIPNLPDVKYDLGHPLRAERPAPRTPCGWPRSSRSRYPKDPLPPTLKGQILLAQRNVKPAADAFSAAIALGGNVAAAHRGLAQALEAQGLTDRAIEHYRKALALQSNDLITLNNLAWLLLESKNQPEEALPLGDQGPSAAPRGLARSRTRSGGSTIGGAPISTRRRPSRRPSSNPPEAPRSSTTSGMTYAKLGKKTDAVSSLRRAAQIDPKLAQSEKIADLIKELGG